MTENLKRIMLVDDEQDIGKILKKAIEREPNFKVDYFDNPVEALSHFKAGQYSLALVDIRMPQMGGIGLYLRIREIDANIKACFISALEADFSEIHKANIDLQGTCLIRKPVLMKNLMNAIRKELEGDDLSAK